MKHPKADLQNIIATDKKIKGNGPVSNFNVSDIILHHEDELKQMKNAILPIERYFSIHISDGDAATILKILLNLCYLY